MANTKQALKYIRSSERKTAQNRIIKSRLKTLQRKVESAFSGGDADALTHVATAYTSASDKAVKKGVIHKNKADRVKARVARMKQHLAKA
ncbi:MAG: 30S ribosomal protein S20 [Opitutales bacterium]